MGNDNEYPLVSVIILNYNGLRFLKECLTSVLKTNYPSFEIVFIDNASQDGSLTFVEDFFGSNSKITIQKNEENFGFAEGNNIGAKSANGKYLVFLNNDTIVDVNWLNELVRTMNSDSSVGAAQSLILSMDGLIVRLGGRSDYLGIDCLSTYHIKGTSSREHELKRIVEENKGKEIFYAWGTALIIRKELFDELGGFDPKFFLYGEETDLCWRIRLRGYRIFLVPSSLVFHEGEGTSRRECISQIRFFQSRNHIATLIKDYNFPNLLKYLPLFLSFLFLHACFMLAKGETNIIKSYVRAIIWNLTNFNYLYKKRLEVQRLIRRVSDSEIKKYMDRPQVSSKLLGA